MADELDTPGDPEPIPGLETPGGEPPVEQPPAADSKTVEYWKSKYNGMKGAAKSQQTRATAALSLATANLELEQSKTSTAEAEVTTLKEQMATMQTQLDTLPDLQTSAASAEEVKATNERLETLMEFPQIIAAGTVTEVEGDDGAKTTERSNPFLQLLMTSTLEGEAWNSLVSDIAARTVVQGQPQDVFHGGGGGTPPPLPSDSRAGLQQQALAAMDEGDYELQAELVNKMAELKE